MTALRLLLPTLALCACATSAKTDAPTATPASEPTAAAPEARPAPAADMWTDFIAAAPKARSRSGRYELALTGLAQVPYGEGSVAIELQAQLTTQHPDILLDRIHKPVRRLVMNDGTELSYPEQVSMGSPHRRSIAALGMDVFHEHSGVWDLVLDATVVEVLRWQEYGIASVGRGVREGLGMGPFDIGVGAEETSLSISFYSTEGRYPGWEATLSQPALRLVSHRYAAEAIAVTDANGQALESGGGAGSGGATVAYFGYATGPSAIAYPVSLRLRLPVRYQLEMSAFRWQDLPLLPLQR